MAELARRLPGRPGKLLEVPEGTVGADKIRNYARVPLKGSIKGSMKGLGFRVVVKILVPFWVLMKIRHLIFRVPKKGP